MNAPKLIFAISTTSSNSSNSIKYPRTQVTVPKKDNTIDARVMIASVKKSASLILKTVMNQDIPQPNIKLNIIRRKNRVLSLRPEGCRLSRNSKGPVIASRVANDADRMPQPPVLL
mmetsp:Transcript_13130/g.36940  ORF Transcript_13130/g.36940 Transcript_13130/m.36940 type:complete len:116 (+) Transcript_13130:2942-3289(+)